MNLLTSHAYTVLLALLLFGIGYAWLVRSIRRRKRDHGYTAFLVVFGDAVVLAGFALIVGLEAAVVLLLCLAAAGLPMIAEYVDDHLQSDEEERERAATARILEIMDSD